MIADFVSKRGGGLLMLGGRRSFAEGGWGGTPVGEVLPVVIENANAKYFSEVRRPTRAGATFPVTQIAGDESVARAKWNDLPPVSTVNSMRELEAGRDGAADRRRQPQQDQIVLAYQRYGRGKAIAMPIQDSWLWRMDAKMAVTDTTHAMFWRRLVRWLVDGVPEQVNLTTTADRVEPGETVKLTAEVLDPRYVEVNDSRVVATVTSPSGKTTECRSSGRSPRTATTRHFVPDESGIYDVQVNAARDQKQLGTRRCTCACRPATPSTSTPRCARR
jgi:hypothetical protein